MCTVPIPTGLFLKDRDGSLAGGASQPLVAGRGTGGGSLAGGARALTAGRGAVGSASLTRGGASGGEDEAGVVKARRFDSATAWSGWELERWVAGRWGQRLGDRVVGGA